MLSVVFLINAAYWPLAFSVAGGLDRLRQLGVAFGDVDPQRQR